MESIKLCAFNLYIQMAYCKINRNAILLLRPQRKWASINWQYVSILANLFHSLTIFYQYSNGLQNQMEHGDITAPSIEKMAFNYPTIFIFSIPWKSYINQILSISLIFTDMHSKTHILLPYMTLLAKALQFRLSCKGKIIKKIYTAIEIWTEVHNLKY